MNALLLFLFLFLALFRTAETSPPGISYTHLEKEGPLSIHILELDPSKVHIEAAHAGNSVLALETPSSIAQRKGAYAAINGGFFRTEGPYAGSSSGILKINGKLLSSPRCDRGAIGWSEKSALIDRLALKAFFFIGKEKFPINGINQPRGTNQTVLYTSSFHTSTLTEEGGKEIAISSDNTVSPVYFKGNLDIPLGGFVYSIGPQSPVHFDSSLVSASCKYQFWLTPLNTSQYTDLWNTFPNIIGGTPVLIFDGAIVTDFSLEKFREGFDSERHPRTAVGLKKNGNWVFVVVDGRQLEHSIGMTLPELAELMHSLHCDFALNLDGGGSSIMYLNSKTMNIPSGNEEMHEPVGYERPVSDVFLIFLKDRHE